jgi:hypothetical protein
MNCKNNNTDNQNNMNVNYNMTIEHKLKCFKLRTTAPQHTPTMKPQHYSKLPTYEWNRSIYVDENDKEVAFDYKKCIVDKIYFKKSVDYHPYQSQWKRYTNKGLQNINCGVPCGKLNNITVVDLDFYKDGEEDGNINLFNQAFGSDYNVFNTYTVRTGSGGWHLYFKYNPLIKQTTDKDTNVDIRSTGGYVVASGTHFTSDTGEQRAYTVQNDCPIAEMPKNLEQWLLDNIYKGTTKSKKTKRNPIIKVVNPITKVEEEIEFDKVNLGVYKYNLSDNEIENNFCEGLPDYFFNDREHHIKFATAMKTLDKYDLFVKWSLKRCYQNEEYELYEPNEPFLKVVWNYIVKHNELYCLEHLANNSETVGANSILSYTKFKPTECHKEKATINIDRKKLGYDFVEEFSGDNKCLVARSDTGTGKTTSMKHYLKNNDKPFISIVSRISLGKEQNKVFQAEGIDCKYWEEIQEDLNKENECRDYFNYKKWDSVEGQNIVITIDSLSKLSDFENFEGYTIYLDEFNSLIEYLITCGNMGNKRVVIYNLLKKVLTQSELIVCSDADISDNSLLLLKNWNINYLYINNLYKHNNGIKATEINKFDNFMEKLNSEPKWLCCADSKTMADIITRLDGDCACYTSDHTGEINLDTHDKVIFSPKIIYGLDSVKTRPVFCYYKGMTITPAAMVQQLARNRNITELFFHFESKMVTSYKYETIEDCKNDIISRDKYGADMFKSVDKQLAEEYINLLAGFEYNYDCYDTNKFGHFINIIKSRGFIVDIQPQISEISEYLLKLGMEERELKNSEMKKLSSDFRQYHIKENLNEINEFKEDIDTYTFLTELPFAPEQCHDKLDNAIEGVEYCKRDYYEKDDPPKNHFPEWIIRKNEIIQLPYSKLGDKENVSLFTNPNELPKHLSVCDMFFQNNDNVISDLSGKNDFNVQKSTADKSQVLLCNKFKNMIGLKEGFLETPLINSYIDESVVTPLDTKTYELFQKEYTTVFRYRGKNIPDLTDKHECIVFYAKMCSIICGGVLIRTVIPPDKKNNKPASCKYKYDIENLQKHMDLYGRRKNNFNTDDYDKYFERHKTIPKSMKPIAYKKYDRYKVFNDWMKSFGTAHFII